jgi:hypothetical protein
MKFGSVCSGIEAASCQKCGETKAAGQFHKKGQGLQAWCKQCHNAYQRQTRKQRETPEAKRQANFKARYGLTVAQVAAMAEAQSGKCAICEKDAEKMVVDHCHATGKVRGMLCHRCNILAAALDDKNYMAKALRYLGADK